MIPQFVQSVASNLVADLVAASVIYVIIERKFKLGDARAQRRQANQQILGFVHRELTRNLSRVDRMIARLERRSLAYPALGDAGWALISQEQVFASIPPNVLNPLLQAYDQVRAANQVYQSLLDTIRDPQLVALDTREEHDRLDQHRQAIRDDLVDRLNRLRKPMSEALEALGLELA